MGAAIVASLASALAFDDYILPPLNAFNLSNSKEWSAMLAFLIASMTASMISVRARRGVVEAEAAQMERLQQQIGELREQAQLLDLAHDVIMVRELDGRIIFWNHGVAERYGWSKQEVGYCSAATTNPKPLWKSITTLRSASVPRAF
jgi:PAS domain-containing protein